MSLWCLDLYDGMAGARSEAFATGAVRGVREDFKNLWQIVGTHDLLDLVLLSIQLGLHRSLLEFRLKFDRSDELRTI